MKIELTVDGKYLALSVSSDKPLNLLLRDDLEIKSVHSHCNGSMCGNCIVLLEGRAVLSCMIPSFAVRGKTIVTYDGFCRTRDYRDIEKAFNACSAFPCDTCYASRVLLIESIVRPADPLLLHGQRKFSCRREGKHQQQEKEKECTQNSGHLTYTSRSTWRNTTIRFSATAM